MSLAIEVSNPFASLIAPADVLAHVERRGSMRGLSSRIVRPLDKPLIPLREQTGEGCYLGRVAEFDAAIDAEVDARLADLDGLQVTEWHDGDTAFGRADFIDTTR